MTPEHETWMSALGDMRRHLDELRRAVADGDVSEVAAFAVPSDLPPLPASCADDARELAARQQDLATEIRGRLASAVSSERPGPRAAVPRAAAARFEKMA